jgi:hypothetical protein
MFHSALAGRPRCGDNGTQTGGVDLAVMRLAGIAADGE